jgi:hypothetical protein
MSVKLDKFGLRSIENALMLFVNITTFMTNFELRNRLNTEELSKPLDGT